MPEMWSIQTPAVPGAVAVVQLAAGSGTELDEVLGRLGMGAVPAGGIALRDVLGVDRALVGRWAETSVHITPHGGAAVVRAIGRRLIEAGVKEVADPDPRMAYPEARSEIEARMLAALARAASPIALDLLLGQPGRWKEGAEPSPWSDILNRLINPPLVVAMGAPNIGKSSLANALAGRAVSIVADEPGTTRDHIGVLIDMGGLVVRYVDTPGIRDAADWIENEAAGLAAAVIASADLVLTCGDATAEPPEEPMGKDALAVALRADLGRVTWTHDVGVSALTGEGLAELVGAVRERLVPAEALADSRPWRFWG